MAANFDFIAPVYDFLVRLVFGKRLWRAQRHFLDRIMPNDKVLVLGGGTGRILNCLPVHCDITYLEYSSKMITRAKNRRQVEFIQMDLHEYHSEEQFDWIICPFFLDCFDRLDLEKAGKRISILLKGGGTLNIIDFNPPKGSHEKLLLWIMHGFFKLAVGLQSNDLQPIQSVVEANGYALYDTKEFGNVFNSLFRKTEKL